MWALPITVAPASVAILKGIPTTDAKSVCTISIVTKEELARIKLAFKRGQSRVRVRILFQRDILR